MPVDVWGPLASVAERFIGGRERRHATDMRITDKARQLRRQLAASFEDWPPGPQSAEELAGWAHKLARGFQWTEPALRELVDLRPDASHRVRHAVGIVRDHYDDAADIINPVVRRTWEYIGDDADPARVTAGTVALRKAVAHVRQCLRTLETVTKATR